jgi:hypothetical protein
MELEHRSSSNLSPKRSLMPIRFSQNCRLISGEKAYALLTVRFWIVEVDRGRQDVYDRHCPGHPVHRRPEDGCLIVATSMSRDDSVNNREIEHEISGGESISFQCRPNRTHESDCEDFVTTRNM